MQLGLRRLASLAVLLMSAHASAIQSVHDARPPDRLVGITQDTVHYDELLDQTGRLTGGRVRLPVGPPVARHPANVRTRGGVMDGPIANRIDLVVVGDGYTQAELAQFAIDGENIVDQLFAQEPLARYRSFFTVHYVDVISNESGVDNDPSQGVRRDTALDMGFWCSGIERLLCVNVSEAYAYAANAPDVDHVLAIANATKYGGAGYIQSDLATASARNIWSPEVAIHEYGHSFANLADEYHYGDGAVYTGPEPGEPNVSIYDETAMGQRGDKWARWLGVNRPNFDGLVSTYEGARYHQFGIYRPSVNSKMRSLARAFNPPSVESWVIEFYKIVRPIDDATPSGTVLTGDEVVFVDPVDPVRPLDIQWFLDGEAISGGTGETLDLAALPLQPGGMYELSVTVVDTSGWVRDEDAREQWMTESRNWLIETVLAGDLNCDGTIDALDIEPFLVALFDPSQYPNQYPNCNINAADINGDGAIDALDIEPLLELLFGP